MICDYRWRLQALPLLSVLLLLTVLIPARSAMALGALGYDFVQLAYQHQELDAERGRSGFAAAGGLALLPNFHLQADYGKVRQSPVSVTQYGLLLGFNARVSAETDFVGRIGGVRGIWRVTGVSNERENALQLQAGLRRALSTQLEVNAFITHQDYSDAQTSLALGGLILLAPDFGISAEVDFSSTANLYRLGMRLQF